MTAPAEQRTSTAHYHCHVLHVHEHTIGLTLVLIVEAPLGEVHHSCCVDVRGRAIRYHSNAVQGPTDKGAAHSSICYTHVTLWIKLIKLNVNMQYAHQTANGAPYAHACISDEYLMCHLLPQGTTLYITQIGMTWQTQLCATLATMRSLQACMRPRTCIHQHGRAIWHDRRTP